MQVHNPNNLPTLPIADLLPTQGNLKDLSEKNYAKLKNTIKRRGFSYPVYVWESADKLLHLLDGHQRQRVLTTEGWNEPIPYLKVPAKDLQEAMARLLEITSQYATITQEGIDEFIGKYDLNEAEVYEATSFDALAFDKTEEEPEVEEDEAPEVSQDPPISKLGEIYQLGKHRVMCGDSTSTEDVEKLMDGKTADIAFTSPPYNAGKTPTEEKMGKDSKYANDKDNKTQSEYLYFLQEFTHLANAYCEYNFVNLQMLSGNKIAFIEYLDNFKLMLADIMIWDKQTSQPAMAENVLNSQFEFVLVLSPKGNRHIGSKKFRGTLSNVLSISKQTKNDEKDHNATFPVEFAAHFVHNFANDIVLDLFLGSGSTLIACGQTDRTCYGMELDPKYVDVIRKRYAKYTNNNELPDNWEELTPAISGGNQAE